MSKSEKDFPKIICQECNKEFYRITNTHLWHSHQMTMQEYQNKYPGYIIESMELTESRASKTRGKTYEEIMGEEKSKELKERKSEQTKEQMKDLKQIEIRKQKCGDRDYEESTKKGIEIKGGYDGNYRRKALQHHGENCQKCGADGKDKNGRLEVHHIDGNNFPSEMGNHDVSNLMVLCKKCHTKLHQELKKTNENFNVNKNIETGMYYIFKGLKDEFNLDLTDENFKDTPQRVARAFSEIFAGINSQDEIKEILSTYFPSEYDGIVIASDIHCFSMCPHHFLPVEYYVDFAYIAKDKMLGISKLTRLVETLAKQPLLQEDFTSKIINLFNEYVEPEGAIVQVRGRHFCMTMRGVKQDNSWTLTSKISGIFEKPSIREEYSLLLNMNKK